MNQENTKRLADLAVSDSGFVFDPHTGATFSVNDSGRAIIEGIKRGLGPSDLVAHLRARFETGGADLARDVAEFLHLLRQSGLLPAAAEDPR